MFDELISLFSDYEVEFSNWISSVVSSFTVTNTVGENTVTSIAEVPWSACVPWSAIFAFVLLIVFIVCFFKFMRSVLCRVF